MGTSSLGSMKINRDGTYETTHSGSWDIRGDPWNLR